MPTDDHQRLDQAERHPEPVEAEVAEPVEDLAGLELGDSCSPAGWQRCCWHSRRHGAQSRLDGVEVDQRAQPASRCGCVTMRPAGRLLAADWP